ncbi:MAG TPA: hypothetical protein VK612_10525, partial [Pyrinomonadaceae bacterium]|nr:hypothetical protein [Pyrinomonadaceae bacterium]
NRMLGVLKRTLPAASVTTTLHDIGHEIGSENSSDRSAELDARLVEALKALESLGGSAEVVRENDKTLIKSESCPFSEAVSEHPEVCKVAESMIGEIVGTNVTETCDRTTSPKCRFVIEAV